MMEHRTLNDHKAMGEVDVWTDRFGERSEYEGSRAPASPIALHEETTA
jgi:hypothetical protein